MTSYHPDDIAAGYCGRCHDWTGERPRHGQLRIRLFVAGSLADETWTDDPREAPRIAAVHQRQAGAADRAGKRWLVEVFDPDAPPAEAYLRFGTDSAGMTAPLDVLGTDLLDAVLDHPSAAPPRGDPRRRETP
jgi:hypothetical protein